MLRRWIWVVAFLGVAIALGAFAFSAFREAPESALPAVTSAIAAPSPSPDESSVEDLSLQFERQVLAALEDRAVRPTGVDAGDRVSPSVRERYPEADWNYVEDVFAGRVTGIPNERRAGLTLREMDEIGEIPIVQKVRAREHARLSRGDLSPAPSEVRPSDAPPPTQPERLPEPGDLGDVDLPQAVPWPLCVRMANCRIPGHPESWPSS